MKPPSPLAMRNLGRKTLPHDLPLWVNPNEAIFFITICAKNRAAKSLIQPGIPEQLLETWRHRHHQQIWHSHLVMIMPDHLHAFLQFPEETKMRKAIANWKRWTAIQSQIEWQRDFFDHRIRPHQESFSEKMNYVLENPVRAGLVTHTKDWPYFWMPS